MTCSVRHYKLHSRIKIAGDMTIYEAENIRQFLLANAFKRSKLFLNLKGVVEVDTTAFQLLISLEKLAKLQKSDLLIEEPSKAVKEIYYLFNQSSRLEGISDER